MPTFKRYILLITKLLLHPIPLLGIVVLLLFFVNYREVRNSTTLESDEFTLATVLPPTVTQPSAPTVTITLSQLATQDGKGVNKCYVAVDSTVYQIIQGRLWNNGVHDPSNMQAYCGRDLSENIDKAPHGRDKLKELYIVGRLKL